MILSPASAKSRLVGMAAKNERGDARLSVARYQVDRLARESGEADDEEKDTAGQTSMEQRAQYVEIAIQQAMRRGEFDDLPGAGKPLEGLQQAYDPDWWIRRKIEREKLTGLGPPALTLRTEDAQLDARLDALHSEAAVREILTDFNKRVIGARRQLQGGPPVVTPTRDIDEEIDRWRERREARRRELDDKRRQDDAALAAMTWRERRRARRRKA
jgi:hypothetical protein